MFYQSMPPVLIFKIDRTQLNSDILVKSPILVNLELDIYAAYEHEKNIKYQIESGSVICHKAITYSSGHFITHLRIHQNTIVTGNKLPQEQLKSVKAWI